MVAFYQHNIAAWMDGTEGLPDGEYRVYHVICQLMYLNNGPIVMHESGLAGRCNQHLLAFRSNVKKLIEKGKLVLAEDGKITNARVAKELARISGRRGIPPADPGSTSRQPRGGSPGVQQGSEGGQASKSLKNQNAAGGRVTKDKTRIEKKEPTPDGVGGARATKPKPFPIPNDWTMKPVNFAYAEEHGFDRDAAARLGQAFVDHHRHKGTLGLDWDAGFRTWVRNEIKYGRGPRGATAPRKGGRSLAEIAQEGFFGQRNHES